MKPTVYVDLDGVLADLEAGYNERWGYVPGPADGPPDKHFWPNIMATPDFFRRLPLTEDADLLTAHLRVLRVTGDIEELNVLTSCSDTWYDSVAAQKREWVEEMFGGMFDNIYTVRKGKDKALHASGSLDILIDDTKENVNAFRKAGGQAILYRNYRDALPDLMRALHASH